MWQLLNFNYLRREVLLIFVAMIGSSLCQPIDALANSLDSPEEAVDTIEDLTQLSLEDLMNVEVTSVSKKKQKLSGAAA
ncbi:MAG: hypothetical protein ACPGYT_13275, partial [Nitrospirales bacterium]